MKTVFKILFLFFLLKSINCFSQGKIEKSKEELKKKSKVDNSIQNHEKNTSSSRSESNDSFQNEIVNVMFQGSMYLTYYSAIGKYETEDHLHSNLSKYPYYSKLSGNFESSDSISPTINYLRIDLEEQILLSQNKLYGNHLKAKIRPFQYFYLQSDLYTLIEYNVVEKNYSNLSLLNIDFCYDRIRFDRFNLGWSLGVNYIGNEIKKIGFAYGLNTDVFITKPVSLYSSMKWSSLNNVPVNEFEFKVKYHKKNYFASIGYEYLKIGSPRYNFLSIGGGLYLF
jgi:hypothetical protein